MVMLYRRVSGAPYFAGPNKCAVFVFPPSYFPLSYFSMTNFSFFGPLRRPTHWLRDSLTGLLLLLGAATTAQAQSNPALRIQALGSLSGNSDVTAFVDQVEIVRVSDGIVMSGAVANTGSTAARGTHDLPAPTDVELVDSPSTGCLYLHGKRPAGAVQNLTRYTTDHALPEENCLVAVGGRREMELGSFAGGTKVWAKLASLTGSTSSPAYSAIVSRIVQ